MRDRALSPGVAVDVDVSEVAEVEAVERSFLKAPQLPFLVFSTNPRLPFTLGGRLRLRLRCRLMFRSSPVVEGRLPRLMEFLLALFPMLLRLTFAEFPIGDLQGVALPTSGLGEGAMWLSKAERDCVEPWPLLGVWRALLAARPGVETRVRSKVEAEARLRYW